MKLEGDNKSVREMTGEELAKAFGVRTAADWLRAAKNQAVPKMLFGEMWMEGELAIMFADTGKGKSILAVQIAEAIARGTGTTGPIETNAAAQSVLYLDFELTEKQFEMRYTEDPEPGDESLKNHYQFSSNLFRSQKDLNDAMLGNFASREDFLMHAIRGLTEHLSAKVVIIDNISYLQRTNEHSGSAARLMQSLKRLKTELGLSILVLAHTPKRAASRALTLNDLAGYKALSNFADSVFAIGQSRIESDIRYIKHLKQRSTDSLYDERNVPAFRVTKRDGNFLAFEFRKFTPEAVHLYKYDDEITFKRAREVQRFAQAGMSQRTIAAEIGISLGSVNKYLHMEYIDQWNVKQCEELDPTIKANEFPGCDEHDCNLLINENELYEADTNEDRERLYNKRSGLENIRKAAQRSYWITTAKIPDPKAAKAIAPGVGHQETNSEPGLDSTV
ncbi:MAG: AAA family ATPase [Acidobacteriota bacterium]